MIIRPSDNVDLLGKNSATIADLDSYREQKNVAQTSVGAAQAYVEGQIASGTSLQTGLYEGGMPTSDPEIRRLEDRIAHSEERGDLKMQSAVAKIEAVVEKLGAQITDVQSGIRALASEREDDRREARSRHTQNLIAFVALFLALLAVLVGFKQIWSAGVQSGQILMQPTPTAPISPSSK